jgi:hypothetical protein
LIAPRPIFVVGDFWLPVVETVRRVRPKHCGCIHAVTSADEIVSILARDIQAADPREMDHIL